MKVTIFLVAVLAVNFSSAFPASSSFALLDDVKDFVDLIPLQKMGDITREYLDDEEVQKLIKFQTSDDIKKYFLGMESVQEFKNLLKFLQSQGLDVYGYLELIHKNLGMPPYVPPPIFSVRKTGEGVKGLFKDLEAILPQDEITALSNEKLESSEEYKHFYNVMNSPEYKKLFCECDASKEFQKVLNFGRQNGFYAYLNYGFNLKMMNIDMVYC